MEYLDDLAQEDNKGVKLGQSKSALTANPVADRAKPLWKTLSNWVTLATQGGCNPARTTFELYVSRPVSGTLVDALHGAVSEDSAQAAILLARDTLWGEAPSYVKRDEVAAEIAPYVENVLSADLAIVAQVVRNFNLTCGSGSPQADVEALLRTHPISQSKIQDIADHMSGVVKRRIDELLEARKPAIISRDDFHTWYGAYVRKIDRDTVLQTRAKRPSNEEAKGHLPRLFVQQLDLIGMPFEDKLEAVGDYLMAAADRTAWAASGEVDASSFEELDGNLKRSWRNKRLACEVAHSGKSGDVQGKALYADCMQVSVAVQEKGTPDHFVPGCLHRLADDLTIGWHPDFAIQLKPKRAA
ncbi:ABC-three component system protein [Bordetella sp. N]|uniref:ABC-three component system protein n=1 Tax=Bordetella sp. N TaxID=1746199 RepID=UPI001E5677F6|nr:ABC-three component system protein [Bordetella sp. N]